ncbi:SHOCT domain-containing protein [Dactylosporangium sp. McL0621]|uniref:SHOCT domain-containing protein n=1 Tax=Dactylosporangium sp. McL0621 TaxID=3415678 RepID=UPI003CE9F882
MYRVRSTIGFLLGVVCLGVALFALVQLVRGGSCASGGNYVSARQCPPGTGKWAFILPLAIIGGLASFILGRLRFGQPVPVPPPHPHPFGNAGGGTPPFRALVRINDGQSFAAGSGAAQPAPATDPLVRLSMLQSLRDSGALSPAEYEQAKAKILAEMQASSGRARPALFRTRVSSTPANGASNRTLRTSPAHADSGMGAASTLATTFASVGAPQPAIGVTQSTGTFRR